jgi:NADPH:quinone reductase-like Zn-dependent oxidoreductase
MIATVYHNYGSPDVLKCEEIEKPIAGDNEALIRVRAASSTLQLPFPGLVGLLLMAVK